MQNNTTMKHMAQQNKDEQKKLLIEIMEADQKIGLYEDHIGDTNKMVTAVEWLQMKMATSSPQEMVENINVWFKEAKQMEKKQIKKSWFDSTLQFDNAASMVDKKEFEKYYNETYNK